MMKNFSRVLGTIMTIVMLVSCVSVTAFATETENTVAELVYEAEASTRAGLYLNDWVEFNYGTDFRNLSIAMPGGSYTLYYSVTQPTTLILWHDSNTQYSFNVSGSGSMPINIIYRCTKWQCISQYANVSASFTIE